MHRNKPGTPTARTVNSNFKGMIERLIASDLELAFVLMSSVKGTSAYWKQFLYDILAFVKQEYQIFPDIVML